VRLTPRLTALEAAAGAASAARLRESLERRVEERTAALQETNAQLELALTDLRAAQSKLLQQERLRAVGEMASGIAHDFNNALQPVVGFTELLLTLPGALDDRERVRQYLHLIHTGATDAASVVGRLREFYRHRKDGEPFGPVDLNGVIEQTVRLTRPRWRDQAQAEGKTIEVTSALGAVPPVLGNEAELREVLTNLIFNAVDAMPFGAITVRTSAPEGREEVVVEVTDTGLGMTEEVRRRCLEPFFTTKGARGTGLGLSMAWGVVHRHEGSIEIESEVGRGTTVRMLLPAMGKTARMAPAPPTARAVEPLRILVVDDEPLVRQVTSALLSSDGHTVTEAASGRDALKELQEGTFHVVFTDRAMPGMSGEQLAQAIARMAPTTKVVLLTGFGDLMVATGDTPDAVDVIVGKPLTLTKLRRALERLRASHAEPGAHRAA
jgi:signal transduction histidine kinase/ActR/RegA family two-component response regulator